MAYLINTAWLGMNNYLHLLEYMCDVITIYAFEFRVWMNNWVLLFHVDVIAYPCSDPDAGLANLCG